MLERDDELSGSIKGQYEIIQVHLNSDSPDEYEAGNEQLVKTFHEVHCFSWWHVSISP